MAFAYRGDLRWLIRHPTLGDGDGLTYGVARIPGPCAAPLHVIFSDGEGWDHVSISLRNRPPNWQEMCFIKDLFWGEQDTVIQYHPPRSEYVNNHPNCLHLWRPQGQELPRPPAILVGVLQQ